MLNFGALLGSDCVKMGNWKCLNLTSIEPLIAWQEMLTVTSRHFIRATRDEIKFQRLLANERDPILVPKTEKDRKEKGKKAGVSLVQRRSQAGERNPLRQNIANVESFTRRFTVTLEGIVWFPQLGESQCLELDNVSGMRRLEISSVKLREIDHKRLI
ncbi:hypothetical protein HAX54_002145 [Datura stramonium]|uniref:Uncharacterized protein n=1 Tax=Datura stramonium TaxID=4076 RepID=A0ABS8T4J1_DATST|nr:hypothetical protein [Datura stramonium]